MTPIDSTAPLVQLALDAAALRHLAISNNIANAGSPGYRRQRVNFEEQLGAIRAALAGGDAVGQGLVRNVQPFLEPAAGAANGLSPVAALDMDVARLAQNTLHYQALLRAFSRHVAILSSAINEGRR
jgi:flagellar basal-body rod protein FlgB